MTGLTVFSFIHVADWRFIINILYILLAILIFGLLIFIHEMGHYLFARLFKVKIYEFSIGMGPKLISRTSEKTGITYSLRAVPFGGYLSMAGEDDESDDENAYYKKPVLQRIVITAAGALVNIIVGMLVLSALVISSDTLYSTTIHSFDKAVEGVASSEEQGLAVGDRITHIDGTRVFTANDLQYELMRSAIKPIDITVVRNGESITVEDITFGTFTEQGTAFGDPDFFVAPEEKSFANTSRHVFARSYSTVKMVYDTIYDLISGRYGAEAVSGPVGITTTLGDAAKSSGVDFIYLAAFISINVGVMNLLPLPALDGGRLVFHIIELIARRPVPRKIEGVIHGVGLMLLLALLALVTLKDLITLF